MGFTPHPADSGNAVCRRPSGGKGEISDSSPLPTAALIGSRYLLGEGDPVDFHQMTVSPADPTVVKQVLAAVPGMIRADVSFEDKTAAVTFDDTAVDLSAITAATTAVGYPSRPAPGTTDE